MTPTQPNSDVVQVGRVLKGWILYDGACGFCYRWVHIWQEVVEGRGFEIKDLQSASREHMLEIPQEHLLDDIRVLTSNGDLYLGADAYLYVARRIWWAWPFYALFSLPGFYWLLWQGYSWFNRNRYRISGACPSPDAAREKGDERRKQRA